MCLGLLSPVGGASAVTTLASLQGGPCVGEALPYAGLGGLSAG